MESPLRGRRIAILATNGVEEVEMTEPWQTARRAGATVELLAPQGGEIQAWHHDEKGATFPVDRPLAEADPAEYDAVIIPGGTKSPDRLRLVPAAVEFVRQAFRAGKPIAAICHGPWLLVEADVVRGLTLTSWPSLRTDITNAGGRWVDREVVVDQGIVTSRRPEDLPAFCQALVDTIAQGPRQERVAAGVAD
jgi:protease I